MKRFFMIVAFLLPVVSIAATEVIIHDEKGALIKNCGPVQEVKYSLPTLIIKGKECGCTVAQQLGLSELTFERRMALGRMVTSGEVSQFICQVKATSGMANIATSFIMAVPVAEAK